MKLRDACREVHDAQKDLVDPAVLGTKNVLSAVAKSKDTVKRVVLTSSFAGERSSMSSHFECMQEFFAQVVCMCILCHA